MTNKWGAPPSPVDAPHRGKRTKLTRAIVYGSLTILSLVGVAAITLFVWAYYSGRDLEDIGAAARELGNRSDEYGCLAATIEMLESCEGFMCGANQNKFLGICLLHAAPIEGFCHSVPPVSEEDLSVAWRKERCASISAPLVQCEIMIGQMQYYCTGDRSSR